MFEKFIWVLLLVCVQLSLTSCGSSNMGGGAAFNTVNASVSVNATDNPLLADIATWADQDTICSSGVTPTIENNMVNFVITSKTTISNGTASSLAVQKVTLTFTPNDSITPILPELYAIQSTNISGTVIAGGTLSVPVEVATHNFKRYFWNTADSADTVLCKDVPVYSYDVKVIFDLVEVSTGKTGTVTAGMIVRVADFIDQ